MGVATSRTLSVSSSVDLSDVTFQVVDPSHFHVVLDLLYSSFHPDEPMSRSLCLYDGHNRIPSADAYALSALNEHLSLMAVDVYTDEMLGVAINGVERREESCSSSSLSEIIKECRHEKFRHILSMIHLARATVRPNIFEQMKTDQIFDIKMVATNKNCRRSGLGTELLRKTIEMATQMGFKAVKAEATGVYSRRAFERLGFRVLGTMAYADYVDPLPSSEGGLDYNIFSDLATDGKSVTVLAKRVERENDGFDENEEADEVFELQK